MHTETLEHNGIILCKRTQTNTHSPNTIILYRLWASARTCVFRYTIRTMLMVSILDKRLTLNAITLLVSEKHDLGERIETLIVESDTQRYRHRHCT